jgi:hypothetical protein
MSERASIFDSSSDFDLTGFEPRKGKRGGEAAPDTIREISEASDFRSREPVIPVIKPPAKEDDASKRAPRRYRTGRNVQLNVKVSAETIEAFYALADREGWVLGETLEKAVAALKKELAGAYSSA